MKRYLLIFAIVSALITNVMAQPDFTAYTAGNPVIPAGPAGSWESGTVWAPKVTVVNDTFYMVYNGTKDVWSQPISIGLAISTDGYNFTKSPSNPILSADGNTFDAYSVSAGLLFYDDGTWYLYYDGSPTVADNPPNIISRATADNPHGPWTRTNDTLLTGGSNGEWDDRVTCPLQIFPTDTGLVMYYWGADDWYSNVFKYQIGMATSINGGQTWQKYDDPATNYPPYAESDPVLKAGITGSYDDYGALVASIVKNGLQWKMFYAGYSSNPELGGICYATSSDGVNWQKYSENPIFTFWDDPLATDGILECPSVILHGNTYFLYYDYGTGPKGIGLATAAVMVPPEFTAYTTENPVVPKGAGTSWDSDAVFFPRISVINDTFYLTYHGSQNLQGGPTATGLATSSDGYHFIKSPANPILKGDNDGFDAYGATNGPLLYDNGTWYLYYNGVATAGSGPGRVISRATADNPHGPWTRSDDTLLVVGSDGEWDDKLVNSLEVLPTDTGFVMYYWGSNEWYPNTFTCQVGIAISTDGGQTWKKYNDPTTTDPPYAESDPVLKAGPESYDADGIWGAGIIKNGTQWEMVYGGSVSLSDVAICFASSPDGVNWEKFADNPIFTFWDDPWAVYGFLEGPTFTRWNSRYFLYYDYGPGADGLGLATYPPIVGIGRLSDNIIPSFELYQNYPNPFNPKTIFSYQLPVTSIIDLSIYNLLGQKVTTLVSENKQAGIYRVEWDATGFASGVYFYKLQAGSYIQTRKLVLLR